MIEFYSLEFNKKMPVYEQIAAHVKRQIILGAAQTGDAFPSRRELAAQTGINPNTAQKACRLMEDEGYLVTSGNTQGSIFVNDDIKQKIENELCQDLVREFVQTAQQNHLSYKKVIALVSEMWEE